MAGAFPFSRSRRPKFKVYRGDNPWPLPCAPDATKIEEQRLTDKIYVDATQPATLNDGAGFQTDCPTLGEAVTAWQRLRPEQKIRATIKVIGDRYIRRTRSTGCIRARSRRDIPPVPAALSISHWRIRQSFVLGTHTSL